VKQRQNELSTNELAHAPEFRAFGDFKVSKKSPSEAQADLKKLILKKNDIQDCFNNAPFALPYLH